MPESFIPLELAAAGADRLRETHNLRTSKHNTSRQSAGPLTAGPEPERLGPRPDFSIVARW